MATVEATEAEIREEIRVAGIRVSRARDDYEQELRYEQRMKDTLEVMQRKAAADHGE